MDKLEFETYSKQVNDVVYILYEKNEPVALSAIYNELINKNIHLDLLGILREIERVGIAHQIKEKVPTMTLNRYEMNTHIKSTIRYLPSDFSNNPYGYFLSKRLDKPIAQSVSTTPNKKHDEHKTITSWYEKPLFIYLIWPLIVGVIILIITLVVS
jgi:hypothetical protein